jgi:hypothetical protein
VWLQSGDQVGTKSFGVLQGQPERHRGGTGRDTNQDRPGEETPAALVAALETLEAVADGVLEQLSGALVLRR